MFGCIVQCALGALLAGGGCGLAVGAVANILGRREFARYRPVDLGICATCRFALTLGW